MKCSTIQSKLLDANWTFRDLEQARVLLEHIEACDACRAALEDYDRLRATLCDGPTAREDQEDAIAPDCDPPPAPRGGYAAMLDRLEHAVHSADLTLRPPRFHRGAIWAIAALFVLAASGWSLALLRTEPGAGRTLVHTADDPAPAVGTAGPARGGDRLSGGDHGETRFMPQQVGEQVELFKQVSEAFERRASWVAQSNDVSDMGVAPAPISSPQSILVLRLTMLHVGEVISQSDLLIVPGQSADLTLPLAGSQELRYRVRTAAGRPTRLMLSAELLSSTGEDQIAAIATHLAATPGHVVPAGQLVTSHGAFELKVGFSEVRITEDQP